MLWIAVHLPLLSLESFAVTLAGDEARSRPLALLEDHRIVAANEPARALGVRIGFKRATALTLAPNLLFGQVDPVRDREALTAVAHAALAFTPSVSIQPPSEAAPPDAAAAAPHTVLLEVRASLRFFGGHAKLLQRLEAALEPLGHEGNFVTAATPLGAALLARVHRRLQCDDLPATCKALRQAPVWLLGPGREHWEALQGMGLHTIDDLRRVPRDGLARRFGPVVLNELDRATGRHPDPREPIVLPPAFESRLELHARVDDSEPLLQGASVLLARLVAWLSAQHAFVRRFSFVMEHEKRSRAAAEQGASAVTVLEIALAEPSRDRAHLLALLRERLARLQLPAPTMDLRLAAADIAQRPPPNTELFPTHAREHEGLVRLIERLEARLGREQVLRLQTVDDHRPEKASALSLAEGRAPSSSAQRSAAGNPCHTTTAAKPRWQLPAVDRPPVRPVWLLAEPEPLGERAAWLETGLEHHPLVDGQPLRLLSGPERVEAGWWDEGAMARDYFIAQKADGALVWVYRERVPKPEAAHGWFLQGRFG